MSGLGSVHKIELQDDGPNCYGRELGRVIKGLEIVRKEFG